MLGPGKVEILWPQEAQIGGSMIKCGLEFFGDESIPGMLSPYFIPNISPNLVL